MATALVTQIAYAVQTLFDPAGTAGRLVDLGKLANYGLLTSFTPAALFTTGVNGAWYDPSDFSTMFQDAAGTTPVTAVGQPVGLMLDKSKGLVLGPELVTNGDFSNGATGWTNSSTGTGTFTASSGAATIIGTDGSNRGAFSQNIGAVAGRFYKVSFNATITSGAGSFFGTGPGSAGAAIANGLNTYYIAAVAGGSFFVYTNSGGGNITLDNISVRELPGNHAFNPSGNSANFPVLSARYNLLTKTEDFNSSTWSYSKTGTGVTPVVTPNFTTDPNGSTTAVRIQLDVGSGVAGNDISYVSQLATNSATSILRCFFKLNSGASKVITFRCGSTLQQITVTDQWKEFSVGDSIGNRADILLYGNVGGGGSVDLLAWHPDLRVANDALNQPAYQRVNTATDYDTVGFKPYLSFNGVNQWLQTNSIDFTYGDKMFVAAGTRKLSDAARGIVTELGNNQLQAVKLEAPNSANPQYFWTSAGSTVGTASYVNAAVAAPITNVLSGIGDISGDQAILRVNGIQAAISIADQGTGNYGNYPMYIGARAGSSFWFNGRLYGLVVAGKQASASEIASTEAWLNQKTGAY